jgi:signal transduction histidine kinase
MLHALAITDAGAQEYQYSEQIHLLEELEKSRKEKDTLSLIRNLNNLGAFYLNHSQVDKTIDYLDESEALSQNFEANAELAKVWSLRGLVYAETRNLEEAEKDFMRAINLYRKAENDIGQAQATLNLAIVLMDQRRFQEAIMKLNRAMLIAKENHLIPVITDVHHYLANCYLALGDDKKAERHQKAYINGFNHEDKEYLEGLTQTFKEEQKRLQDVSDISLFEFWKRQKELEILKLREREIAALAKARKAKLALREKELELSSKALAMNEARTNAYSQTIKNQVGELELKNLILIGVAFILLVAIVIVFVLARIIERKKQTHFLIKKRQLIIERQNRELREKNDLIRASEENIKNYIETLKSKNKELKGLNKENRQLIRLVANDLRQPLTNSETLIRLIEHKKVDLNEKEQESIENIQVANVRLNRLVARIIDEATIGRLDSSEIKLERINISNILRDTVAGFQLSAESKDISLQLSVDDDYFVDQDPTITPHIFENLLSNSIKFSPMGSLVQIRMYGKSSDVTIEFQDEGPGLNEEDRTHLFKRYYILSARPTAGEFSSGLGLSITKKYVEVLGGTITYMPVASGGSIFSVTFPITNNKNGKKVIEENKSQLIKK